MQSPFPDWLWPKQKARIKTLRTSSKWIKTGVSFNSQKKKHPLGRLANCIGFMLPHPPPGPKETERSLKERGRTHVEVSGFEIPNSMTFRSHLATNSHFAHKLGKANRGTKLLSLSYFHKQKFQGMALVHIVNQHTKSCLMPPCQKRENLVPAQNSQGTMFFCCPYLAWTTAITIITTTSATTTTPRLMTFKQANLGDLPQLWMPCELPSLKLPLAKSIMCACRVYINSLYSRWSSHLEKNWCFSPSPPGQLLTPKEESWRRWRLPGGSWWQRSVPRSLDEKIQIQRSEKKKH